MRLANIFVIAYENGVSARAACISNSSLSARVGVWGATELVGFSAKNRFYRANRDLGRIFSIRLTNPIWSLTPDFVQLAG
jgi:hypothetical protein